MPSHAGELKEGISGESLADCSPCTTCQSRLRARCPRQTTLVFWSVLACPPGRTGLLRETWPGCELTDSRVWADTLPTSQPADDFQTGIFSATSPELWAHKAASLRHPDSAHRSQNTSSVNPFIPPNCLLFRCSSSQKSSQHPSFHS